MAILPSRWLGSVKRGCLIQPPQQCVCKWLSVWVWLRKVYSDWPTTPADAVTLADAIPTLERKISTEAVAPLALL